jgi:hypothetical protein
MTGGCEERYCEIGWPRLPIDAGPSVSGPFSGESLPYLNKFSRAVAFGHHQEFLQGEKSEQEIAEGCRRLIKNAIICWNYLYLSQRIAREDMERRKELIAAVQHGSMVAWHHINLHGEYDFSDEKLQDSVGLHTPPTLAVPVDHHGEEEKPATLTD